MSISQVSVISLTTIAALVACAGAAAAGAPSGMNVNVINTPTVLTQSLDERGRNPYQANFGCSGTQGACTATASSGVPANKRLVLEVASVRVLVPAGMQVQGIELRCSTDEDVPLFLPARLMGTVPGFGDVYYAMERVVFYCDAGQFPYVVTQFPLGIRGAAEATVTGYFVDL